MKTWMKTLAEHFEAFQRKFPEDNLLILFDIDGTIIDMRYLMRHALRSFDASNGTDYFKSLRPRDIDFHEEDVHELFTRHDIPKSHQQALLAQYWNLLLSSATVTEAHKPFQGVLEVIRFFQLQPNTFVGVNTGRPESMRTDTLRTLNTLGEQFNVRFSSDHLFMKPDDWKGSIPSIKRKGVEHFWKMGYRVFAFVDNEPENLRAVSETDDDNQILLLHADTIFKSIHTTVPERVVKGNNYNVKELVTEKSFSGHIQLVWYCTLERDSLAAFMGSNIHWMEIDLETHSRARKQSNNQLSHTECLESAVTGDKCIKFNLGKSVRNCQLADELSSHYGISGTKLWFRLGDAHVFSTGSVQFLRKKYPDAIIEYDVDFLGPSILNEPIEAEDILSLLKQSGINRFAMRLGRTAWRRIAGDMAHWGFDVHIDKVTTFEAFLQTALLAPRSMSLHFGFEGWKYFGQDSGHTDHPDLPLKLSA